jgi:hypothetical protein
MTVPWGRARAGFRIEMAADSMAHIVFDKVLFRRLFRRFDE